MRYSTEIKQEAVKLYRTLGNTHKVGNKLGIHPETVYHCIRTIVPEERKSLLITSLMIITSQA